MQRICSIDEPLLPVTVLSGFLGAGKTTLLNHLLNTDHGMRIALIVNDMSEVNTDARLVRSDARMVEMQNGCICCTLREDLLIEVGRLAREGRFDYLLIESTGVSEPLPVAETFTFADESGESLSQVARLDTMVTVVDAERFVHDFEGMGDLRERGIAVSDEDERTVSDLLVDQVEFANVIVVNKCDRVKEGSRIDHLEAMLRQLNPDARIVRSVRGVVPLDQILGTGMFCFEKAAEAPGWLKVMRGEEMPETDEYGIGSFVYRASVPFHPQRFHTFLEDDWEGLLRGKGFFYLAHQPELIWSWSVAGGTAEVAPYGYETDEWTPEQELVFIGQNLPEAAIRAALDDCLVRKDETSFSAEGTPFSG